MFLWMDFEKDDTLKSLLANLEPSEEDAASRLIPQLLQVAQIGHLGKVGILVKGPTFFSEVDKYIEEHARGGGWSPQTVQDVRGDFDQFKAVLGGMCRSPRLAMRP